jgi:hypothetical protein
MKAKVRNNVNPILFNNWSITRILLNIKFETRRLGTLDSNGNLVRDNRYLPGDYLYGRETFATHPVTGETIYYEDYNYWKKGKLKWKPNIHLPKSQSRILLKVTDLDYEHLQDLTEADAIAEGCGKTGYDPKEEYFRVWEDINGIGSVAKNPIVKVISFDIVSTTLEETQRILNELEGGK